MALIRSIPSESRAGGHATYLNNSGTWPPLPLRRTRHKARQGLMVEHFKGVEPLGGARTL